MDKETAETKEFEKKNAPQNVLELMEKRKKLEKIAKQYRNTLKKNYRVSNVWFEPKFEVKICKKKRNDHESSMSMLPKRKKTRIGCEENVDFFLQSFGQVTVVITQTDEFANIYEINPRPKDCFGARIQITSPTVILEGDIFRLGKTLLKTRILAQNKITLLKSTSKSSEYTIENLTNTTKIGSASDCDLKILDRMVADSHAEITKGPSNWTIRSLTSEPLWKYLANEQDSPKRSNSHPLCPDQLIHIGGNRISLVKVNP